MTEGSRATDIVERLRKGLPAHADSFTQMGYERDEAATEITRLRSELESAREETILHKSDAAVAWGQAEGLRAELERFKSEREYIVGCNDGWDEAALQAAELARSYWHGDKPHMKQWDEACVTISDDIEKMVSSRALANEGKED